MLIHQRDDLFFFFTIEECKSSRISQFTLIQLRYNYTNNESGNDEMCVRIDKQRISANLLSNCERRIANRAFGCMIFEKFELSACARVFGAADRIARLLVVR